MNLFKKRSIEEKQKDELQLVENFCYHLSNDFQRVIGYNPTLKVEEFNENDDYYKISETLKYKALRFDLYIYYDISVLYVEDTEEVKKNRKLICAYIDWFGVDPQGQGNGTQMISYLLMRIKQLKSVDRIYLVPQGAAINFWRKCGFYDIIDQEDRKISRVIPSSHGALFYNMRVKIK